MGDELKVLVIGIDEHDRVKLSRRRALEELGLPDDLAPAEGAGGEEGGGDRDRDRDRDGGRDRDRDRPRRSGGGGGGRPRR